MLLWDIENSNVFVLLKLLDFTVANGKETLSALNSHSNKSMRHRPLSCDILQPQSYK